MSEKEYPKIIKGVTVMYMDKNNAVRCEKVFKRIDNTLTVKNCLNKKREININRVIGFWEKGKKTHPLNLTRLSVFHVNADKVHDIKQKRKTNVK